MSSWNMPPGTTTSMIPGNRPEDLAYEKLIDDILAALGGTEQHPLGEGDTVLITEKVLEDLAALVSREQNAGYQQAMSDAELEQFYAQALGES